MLKILGGQTCPKNMKLPKVLTRYQHLKTKRGGGGQYPPPRTLMSGIIFQYSFFHAVSDIIFQYSFFSRC